MKELTKHARCCCSVGRDGLACRHLIDPHECSAALPEGA